MKNWKEQLKDLKRVFVKATRDKSPSEETTEKPTEVDFKAPESWLAMDQTSSTRDSKDKKYPSSNTISRSGPAPQGGGPGRGIPSISNTNGQPTVPSASGISIAEPSSTSRASTLPVFTPRIDGFRTLNMPKWLHMGEGLQHPDRHDATALPMVIRIGVDFGTAFTKVAIRAGVDLIFVDWEAVTGDRSPTGLYVMPGLVACGPDGNYCWRRSSDSDIHANLKLPIFDMADSDECPVAALAFLALVIRYARAFLYRHQDVGRKLVARSLRWEFNIGCPTQPHEKLEVVQFLNRIARTAWQLAAVADLREANIMAAWLADQTPVGLETEPGVVPEFVAQIAGYLNSTQVTEGLHALIDVGAATLDVATFNIVNPNDFDTTPSIPIFFSSVKPYGTHYLNQYRYSSLELEPTWDDTAPVELADEFSSRHGKTRRQVDDVDSGFLNRVANCIYRVIDDTRTNVMGDPRSPAWREGLPIFVTGGGASCELYRQAIEKAHRELKQRLSSPSRFRFIELNPLGTNIPSSNINGDVRMTVAIGLTQDAESIALVVPHRDIERITYGNKKPFDHSDLYGD